jgi:hypothetical protein
VIAGGRSRIVLAACIFSLAIGVSGCGGGSAEPSPAERAAPAAARPRTGGVPWRAPADAVLRARLSGVPVGRYEFGVPGHPGTHIHAHLDVFVNGKPARIPAGIGIDISVRGVQHGKSPDGSPAYGGITICARVCIAALHTHDDTGVLHIESQQARTYRLGQFFTEWNVRLDGNCVGGYCRPGDSVLVFVNGKRYTGNPAALALRDRDEIAIVIGSPPKEIPHTYF